MPRKKLIRRFEPRYTVSQEMVDRESKYVAREHEDCLLQSIDELRKRLETFQTIWRQINETAELLVNQQGEREALAYRCLMMRDLYHIMELYCACMRGALPESSDNAPKPPPGRPAKPVEEESKAIPFVEWLFEAGNNK